MGHNCVVCVVNVSWSDAVSPAANVLRVQEVQKVTSFNTEQFRQELDAGAQHLSVHITAVVKAIGLSYGNSHISTPHSPSVTAQPTLMKLETCNYCCKTIHHTKRLDDVGGLGE